MTYLEMAWAKKEQEDRLWRKRDLLCCFDNDSMPGWFRLALREAPISSSLFDAPNNEPYGCVNIVGGE